MTIETSKTWKILALGKITLPITERRVCCEQLVEICTFLQLDHNQAEVRHFLHPFLSHPFLNLVQSLDGPIDRLDMLREGFTAFTKATTEDTRFVEAV
ncbi:uncharacterized protein UDID_17172 [Ustilago sp. UG-2017a]|nr:uncharacterized protein UDID_17172 [Ustilago sp. UG-2017a]